mgnify:CR=1 FL=1
MTTPTDGPTMGTNRGRQPIPYRLPLVEEGFERIDASGEIASGQLLTFVSHDVYDFIKTHSIENDPNEVGGVLLGQYCVDDDTRFVIVPAAVACDLGSATPASISFPPEFWQKVEEIHTAEYPGLLRLGPFHSHPGYGVQPSGTDRATILTSFSRPHHISIIYDPHDDQIGYTCWQGGDLLPSSGLFVYRHRRPDDLLSELMGAGSE